MTPLQMAAMMAAAAGHIYTPAKGAYRLRGRGEVDHIRCFSSRTIRPLLEKGWVVATNTGCYVATEAGKAALK
ncbi:hypothetical protein [Burkholderia gladioli]|uniref:hypothetical protein n=1 Tax=Burkholderia gladioli TaxID=28095 RepID=UPI00163FD4A8|nr:hypothetical protein [Burkholderia gladioli]